MHSNTEELMDTVMVEDHHIRITLTVFTMKMVTLYWIIIKIVYKVCLFRSVVEQPSWTLSWFWWKPPRSFTHPRPTKLANHAWCFSSHPCRHIGICWSHYLGRSYASIWMDDCRSNLLNVYSDNDCVECIFAYQGVWYDSYATDSSQPWSSFTQLLSKGDIFSWSLFGARASLLDTQ